jgi:hypothetical protein
LCNHRYAIFKHVIANSINWVRRETQSFNKKKGKGKPKFIDKPKHKINYQPERERERERDLVVALKAIAELGVNLEGIIIIVIMVAVALGLVLGFARDVHHRFGSRLLRDFELRVPKLLGSLLFAPPWCRRHQPLLRLRHC